MDEDRTKRALKRVAQALSEDVFREGRSQGVPNVPAISEELELLRLFSATEDPEARRACLQYVRDLAQSVDMVAG